MKNILFWIATPWKAYPVKLWRPNNPVHGDYTTDVAFVLAQIGKDSKRICDERIL